MPGSRDWGGGAQSTGANKLASLSFAVGAGATVFGGNQLITKPGYLINVRPQYSGASGAIPFCQIDVRWGDAPQTIQLGFERWVVPIHATGLYVPVVGRGPTAGSFFTSRVVNLDTVQPITFFADIWETTQHASRDDWRDADVFGQGPPPGYPSVPGASMANNILFAGGSTLPAGQSITYLLPLYAGQVWVDFVAQTGRTVQFILQIPASLPAVFGGGTQLFNDTAAGLTFQAALPRIPVELKVVNPGATNPLTWQASIVAMEYAS